MGGYAQAVCVQTRARTRPGTQAGDQMQESGLGLAAHRLLYRSIALLPAALRQRTLGTFFNILFRFAPDAWEYESSGYEVTKRQHLLDLVDAQAQVVVEFGCASGYNLRDLARRRPGCQVIGVDVSKRAVLLAEQLVRDHRNVTIHCTAKSGAWDRIARQTPEVDVVVLSEVLYYLGSAAKIAKALKPLRTLMHEHTSVVMVHSSPDAQMLHRAAAVALGVTLEMERIQRGEDRHYGLAVARGGHCEDNRSAGDHRGDDLSHVPHLDGVHLDGVHVDVAYMDGRIHDCPSGLPRQHKKVATSPAMAPGRTRAVQA